MPAAAAGGRMKTHPSRATGILSAGPLLGGFGRFLPSGPSKGASPSSGVFPRSPRPRRAATSRREPAGAPRGCGARREGGGTPGPGLAPPGDRVASDQTSLFVFWGKKGRDPVTPEVYRGGSRVSTDGSRRVLLSEPGRGGRRARTRLLRPSDRASAATTRGNPKT